MDRRYRVDADRIVYEVLDSEITVVDLDTGYYYVLEGTGAEVWSALVAGASETEVAAALLRRYAGSSNEIEQAVADFVAQLTAEHLLVPSPDGADPDFAGMPGAAAPDQPQGTFTLPVMYKYTDMANLVQMDPIRDFEEGAWPRRRRRS